MQFKDWFILDEGRRQGKATRPFALSSQLKEPSHFGMSSKFVIRPILVSGPNYKCERLYFGLYSKPPHG